MPFSIHYLQKNNTFLKKIAIGDLKNTYEYNV